MSEDMEPFESREAMHKAIDALGDILDPIITARITGMIDELHHLVPVDVHESIVPVAVPAEERAAFIEDMSVQHIIGMVISTMAGVILDNEGFEALMERFVQILGPFIHDEMSEKGKEGKLTLVIGYISSGSGEEKEERTFTVH